MIETTPAPEVFVLVGWWDQTPYTLGVFSTKANALKCWTDLYRDQTCSVQEWTLDQFAIPSSQIEDEGQREYDPK